MRLCSNMFDKDGKKALSRISFIGIAVLCFVAVYTLAIQFFPHQFEFLSSPMLGAPTSASAILEAKKIIETCSLQDKNICYNQELARTTTEHNMRFAIQVLHALQDIDPILRNCHVQSHHIANAATRKNPDAWKKLIQEADPSECGGGFIHGVLEVHIGYDSTFSITTGVILDLCSLLGPDFIDHKVRTCSHFMGHLSLVEVALNKGGSYESDISVIKAALLACRDLPDALRLECDNGVFMEDSFKLTLVDHNIATIPVRDEARMIRQKARCRDYSGMEGIACWTDLAEIFAELYNYDAWKTYEACKGAPELEEQRRCYLKAVVIIVASPTYDDSTKLAAICAPYANTNSQYQECLRFEISGATHYSIKLASRAATLCSTVSPQFQNYCFGELGRQLTEVGASADDKRAICGPYPQFSRLCTHD